MGIVNPVFRIKIEILLLTRIVLRIPGSNKNVGDRIVMNPADGSTPTQTRFKFEFLLFSKSRS